MRLRIILAAGVALALTACGGSETTENAAANAAETETNAAEAVPADNEADAAATNAAEATNVASTAAPAATPAAGASPTKDFIVGKWGEDGECRMAIDFKADGTMDGPFEGWDYKDGALEMKGNPQKMVLKVIDKNTMELRLDGTGKPHKMTCC